MTEVKIEKGTAKEEESIFVNKIHYKIGEPIYKKTNTFNRERPLVNASGKYHSRDKYYISGYTIKKKIKKYSIYNYENTKSVYHYRTRYVINYEEAVTEYYAKNDNQDILLDEGYIKMGRITPVEE